MESPLLAESAESTARRAHKGVPMGQATIDLPDPSHHSTPAAGPSADDLLAQLAGEEIDRLLAEADVERPIHSHETRPANPLTPPQDQTGYLEISPTPPKPLRPHIPKQRAPPPGHGQNPPRRPRRPIRLPILPHHRQTQPPPHPPPPPRMAQRPPRRLLRCPPRSPRQSRHPHPRQRPR